MGFLEIKNVSKIYGGGKTTCIALSDVCLDIDQGKFIAITGPSGSGKTTLLNIISGIDRSYEGDVIFKDRNLRGLRDDEMTVLRRREISVIFQFFNLVSSLTVEENITLCVELDNKRVNEDELVSIMKKLDLLDKRNAFVNELSGGQQQRVAIARALLCKPSLILADEPTGNLDSENAQNIIRIVKELTKTQRYTILMVSHDEQIAAQADRIIRFKDGRVICDEYII